MFSNRDKRFKPNTNLKEDVIDDKLIFLKQQNEKLLEENNKYKNDLSDIANVIESDDIDDLPDEINNLVQEIDILRSQLDEYQKTISTITIALQDHLP
jgi:chromosome segregation ATPase